MRHPSYNPTTKANDVALIFLPEGVVTEITSVPRVELNRNPNNPSVGQVLEVFGWGATCEEPGTDCPNADDMPNLIQTGNLEYVANEACNILRSVTEDMLCAKTDSTDGVASGRGDSGTCDSFNIRSRKFYIADAAFPPLPSGGPLVMVKKNGNTVQVGVVSYGTRGKVSFCPVKCYGFCLKWSLKYNDFHTRRHYRQKNISTFAGRFCKCQLLL